MQSETPAPRSFFASKYFGERTSKASKYSVKQPVVVMDIPEPNSRRMLNLSDACMASPAPNDYDPLPAIRWRKERDQASQSRASEIDEETGELGIGAVQIEG